MTLEVSKFPLKILILDAAQTGAFKAPIKVFKSPV